MGSANAVLGKLFEKFKPDSVVDVGCGYGAWLAAAESLGSQTLVGLDGDWVKSDELYAQSIDFRPQDIEKSIELQGQFDLCISLEVGEHISEQRAGSYVKDLCGLADLVLFSAAIKSQGGTNHVNEQWQSYWVDLFEKNGFECFDVIRPWFWEDETIEWYYRQNIFVFSKSGTTPDGIVEFQREVRFPSDIVHPGNYDDKSKYKSLSMRPNLRFCLGVMKRYLLSLFR